MKRLIGFTLSLGLIGLLAACGKSDSGQGPTPVQVQESEVRSDTSDANVSEAEPDVQAEVVSEKHVPTEEPTVVVHATAVEEVVLVETTPTVEIELAATEETMMPEQPVVTRPTPTAAQLQLLAGLPVIGSPPELHNEVWFNSAPLKLSDLRGKVVIVEFWTYG